MGIVVETSGRRGGRVVAYSAYLTLLGEGTETPLAMAPGDW